MPQHNQTDLQELLQLARDRSVSGRTRLAQVVGDLFFDTKKVLTDRERALMGEILRQLIHDVEMTVRRALAERLASHANAPPELATALANDQIEVAHPILTTSAVLQDIDLIEIIQHRTMKHRLAIAMRNQVSEAVSDALVETGSTDIVKSLLENANAEISEGTMEYLVEESQRIDEYQNPLVNRRDLSPELARRMYWWVSAALRNHIIRNFEFDPSELEEQIEEAVTGLISDTGETGPETRKSVELAKRLKANNVITPKLLVQTLREGEISLFEGLFGELTGLRTTLVRRFIFEQGGEGLAIACKAVGIDKPDFASIFLLSRSARPGEKIVDPNELSRAIDFFDRVRPETAQKVLRRWHLDPDFLVALKQLEGVPADWS